MIAVLQRITSASVDADGVFSGKAEQGMMILLGCADGDTKEDADILCDKIAGLRIFTDGDDKMNLSLADVGGSVLMVSQFTLLGDARHGRRPSFIEAARPETASPLYDAFCDGLNALSIHTEKGVFGADMQVSLTNDGPVTILIDSKKVF